MDIVCAEAELMLSAYPAEILADLHRGGVRQTGNVPALPAEAERPRNTDADNPVCQIGRVPDSLDSQFLGRDLLRRLASEICRPKNRCPEGTDDAAADQISITHGKRLRFPVVDNRIGCIRTIGRRTGAQQVSRVNGIRRIDDVRELVTRKQRVLLAPPIIDFSDRYVFIGAGLDSELNLAARIDRYRQMVQRAQRHRGI